MDEAPLMQVSQPAAELPPEAQLPELGELDLVLLTGPRAPTEPSQALISAIMSRAWVRTRAPV